ncbi:MAG: PQQ-binding-like beta-propeller repeat protein [Thermoguttaceae bacterium]
MTTIFEVSSVQGIKRLYWIAVTAAIFSGTFCVVFIGLLFWNYLGVSLDGVSISGMSVPNRIGKIEPDYRNPSGDSFNLIPTETAAFIDLKKELAIEKNNESLKESVRNLDQSLRFEYFRKRAIVAKTVPLLTLAAIVFFIALRVIAVLKRKIPCPEGDAKTTAKMAEKERLNLGIQTISALALLIIGLAVGFILTPQSKFEQVLLEKVLTQNIDGAQKNLNSDSDAGRNSASKLSSNLAANSDAGRTVLSVETPKNLEKSGGVQEISPEPPLDRDAFIAKQAQNWASFRNFDGSATAKLANIERVPTHWNVETGEQIRWKVEVPLPGKSSPVIWENRLFLTGADETKRAIFCFDTETGNLIWMTEIPAATPESAKPFKVGDDTGFAAPTMVLDGKRAFALFANGDVAAVDFDGKLLWSKSLGIPESLYGFSSSPALYFDRLIVQYDVGDGTDGKSKILAFDVKTGNIIWETPRESGNSWSSPIVTFVAGKFQIITCGDPFVISYNPEDGQEIWRVKCLSGDVGPSPAAFNDVVIVSNQAPRTTAIDASGTGDVSATHVLWNGINALPDTPSTIISEKGIYTLDSGGYLTSYNPKNINERNKRAAYWELEIGGGVSNFYSSPLLVGDRIYAFDMTKDAPKAHVIDLSKVETDESGALTDPAALIIAENPMSEPCVTSPAFYRDALFIRSDKTIYCIGSK